MTDLVVHKVKVNQEGSLTAGHSFKLICTASRDPLLSASLEVEWLDPKSTVIKENSSIKVTGPSSSTNESIITRMLVFNSLNTSNGGNYTCRVNLTIPDLNIIGRILSQYYEVIVKRKSLCLHCSLD